MKNWRATLIIAFVVGIVASIVALNAVIELSAPAMFLLILAMGYGAFTVWDVVLLKNANTYEEIVTKGNIAYAIYMCIPALLVLAAALVK